MDYIVGTVQTPRAINSSGNYLAFAHLTEEPDKLIKTSSVTPRAETSDEVFSDQDREHALENVGEVRVRRAKPSAFFLDDLASQEARSGLTSDVRRLLFMKIPREGYGGCGDEPDHHRPLEY